MGGALAFIAIAGGASLLLAWPLNEYLPGGYWDAADAAVLVVVGFHLLRKVSDLLDFIVSKEGPR